MSDIAESIGVDPAVGQQMLDRILEFKKQLDANPPPNPTNEEQLIQIKNQMEAELEKMAVEVMGDKGHEFVKKLKAKGGG